VTSWHPLTPSVAPRGLSPDARPLVGYSGSQNGLAGGARRRLARDIHHISDGRHACVRPRPSKGTSLETREATSPDTRAGAAGALLADARPQGRPASRDDFGRTIDYLRIAITDRCNYRCVYCMPATGVAFKPHESIMTYEEIERFVRIAAEYGIKHIRLTGGEPLVRKGVCDLARGISEIPGIEDISITTNGSLLTRYADELVRSGVSRVNISLDTLDPAVFHAVSRVGNLEDALAGIDAALAAGFKTVKINTVAVRSLNQDFLGLARMSVDRPLHVRFIEYMPIGDDDIELEGDDSADYQSIAGVAGWSQKDTIPTEELRALISSRGEEVGLGPLVSARGHRPDGHGPADYWHFEGALGTVGFISAMSNHFCASCNRLRLTADGNLRPCLFSDVEVKVREYLRAGDDDAVRDAFERALRLKPEAHVTEGTERYMSQIGG
jgi:cyclic pyranopterin phosphate synthase